MKLNYRKEDKDYFLRFNGFEFYINKQSRGLYCVEVCKWINNGMHTQSVDFPENIVTLKEAKQSIENFLFN